MKIGVLGAGQLARMMALAGIPMGMSFSFYDSAEECCAEHVGNLHRGAFDDSEKLKAFAAEVDVVTYEFENVPLQTIELLPNDTQVFPPKAALDYTQDRLKEKELFRSLDIQTPPFLPVQNTTELEQAAKELGFPFVLKTRWGGYDGKGQKVLQSENDFAEALKICEAVPCIAEGWVKYEREVSLIAVYGQQGEKAYYDINQNEHRNGVLYSTENKSDAPIQSKAIEAVDKLSQKIGYVGTLTVEFFQCGEDLLANEYAPRVHNSGHWTIDGSACSQFENHLRAITNLPLGSCQNLGFARMYNLLGSVPDKREILNIEGLHRHDYQKSPRSGRKVGHFNLLHSSEEASQVAWEQLLKLIE